MVVDSTGTVQAKYTYYPFGDNLSSWIAQGTDYKFTGKELDEESNFNLYYFGARYYDAKIARWISVDPAAGKYPDWSPYVYSLNNPVKVKDPDGEAAVIALGAGGATVGVGTATGVAITITTVAAVNHCVKYYTNPGYRAAVDAGTMSMGKAIGGAFGSVVAFAKQATGVKKFDKYKFRKGKSEMTQQGKPGGPDPFGSGKVVPVIPAAQKAMDEIVSGAKGVINSPELSKVITSVSEIAGSMTAPAVPAATEQAAEAVKAITTQKEATIKEGQPQQKEPADKPKDDESKKKKVKQPPLWEDKLWDVF